MNNEITNEGDSKMEDQETTKVIQGERMAKLSKRGGKWIVSRFERDGEKWECPACAMPTTIFVSTTDALYSAFNWVRK